MVAEEEAASGLRAYSVAPGVVDTAMQERIRECDADDFPDVDRFHELKASDGFNTGELVARHFLAIAFDPDATPDSVATEVPFEGG